MTREEREEAIKVIQNFPVESTEERKAVLVAVQALEQMPVITTTGGEGAIYYPQVEGVTPTVVDAGKQDPCDTCGYEEGSIYCKEHCPHEAKIKQTTCDDAVSRQWLMKCVNEGWIKFDTEKDENRFIHLVRDIAPSATIESKIVALLQKTYADFCKCEGGEGWLKIDGKEYSTDVGYAIDGIRIFVEVLNQRLAESGTKT